VVHFLSSSPAYGYIFQFLCTRVEPLSLLAIKTFSAPARGGLEFPKKSQGKRKDSEDSGGK